jgi:hypothetical protein
LRRSPDAFFCAGETVASAAADLRAETTLASLAVHKAEREEKKYEEIRKKIANQSHEEKKTKPAPPTPKVRSRDAPDTVFAGYPVHRKAGYRISGKGRIPDIRPDTWLDNYIFGKISNK